MNIDSRPGSTLRTKALALANEIVQSSARDVVQVLFRHKWITILFFLGVSSAAALYAFTAPEIYMSEAKLLLRPGRESIAMDASAVSGNTVAMGAGRENELNSEISIIKSQALAEQVIDSMIAEVGQEAPPPREPTAREKIFQAIQTVKSLPFRLIPSGPAVEVSPRDAAAARLSSGIEVQVERNTNILIVSYEGRDPAKARDTLERLIEGYLDRHIEVFASQVTPEFFEEQAKKLQTELAVKEAARDEFRTANKIASLEQQKSSLLDQIMALETELNTAAAEASGAEARIASIEKALSGQSATLITSENLGQINPAADRLKASLVELRLKETDLSARYPDTHRPLVELRQQIKQTEEMMKREEGTISTTTKGLNPNHMSLQLQLDTERANLNSQKARMEAIKSSMEGPRSELSRITMSEAEMTRLTRDVEVAEQEYRNYREGLQRARISAAMDLDKVSNVSVVQPATFSPVPVKPQRSRILALGLFLGLFGGVFLAFAREYLDDTIHNKETAESKLGVPVLAVITNKEFETIFR